jgi:hypothetical protein
MDDQDGYFGEGVTARYDESLADMCEPGVVDAVVEVLAGLAGGGHALELGIGTGRIALPLARRGVTVHGIDLSRAAKADGTFTVAYLVFNTDHESDNSGGAGGLLPQRRGSPRPRRLLRHRGHDP